MGFSDSIRTKILLKCKRYCCLCGNYAGIGIELHHINQKADGGLDTEDNCIPLCFNCHAVVATYNPRHPKGSRYTEKELKTRRDEIYTKVNSYVLGIYNEKDMGLACELLARYSIVLENLIQLDPCSMPVHYVLISRVKELSEYLSRYTNIYCNIDLNNEKIVLVQSLNGWLDIITNGWLDIITNENNFHSANGCQALMFNNWTVNSYREIMCNLRINIQMAYLKFRCVATGSIE